MSETGLQEAPFSGVEPYYERLFQQIKDRHNPLGTGGDMSCLIAMIEWLWKRHLAHVPASPAPERAALVREVHIAFNVAVHRAGGPQLPACDGLDCAICEHVREAAALLKGEQS